MNETPKSASSQGINLQYFIENKKTLIFDFDGTLVDSNHIWQQIDDDFFKKRNIVPEREKYFDLINGKSLKDCAAITIEMYNLDEKPEDIVKEWEDAYITKFQTAVQFLPHAEDFLHKLIDNNVKWGIATAGQAKLRDFFFKRFPKLDTNLKAFVSCDHVGKNKPDPAVYQECMRQLGTPEEDCVIFEDSVVGLTGARNTRAQVVCVFSEEKRRDEKLQLCDHYIECFSELM